MDKQDKVITISKGFLSFLKKEKSLNLLPEILERLKTSIFKNPVLVISPIELDETQKDKMKKIIRKLTGLRDFEVTYEKDESIIDGIKLIYKDKLWDLSLSSQIKEIVNSLE